MRFYDFEIAPNPRRVRLFIAEKGLEIPTTQIDLRAGEQFSDEFRAVNSRCMVPAFETDDGTRLTECVAICSYLEELFPEPPLLGRNAEERARVRMWDHIAEVEGLLAVGEALRNTGDFFAGRALPGPDRIEQIPALADRGQQRASGFFDRIETELAGREFLAGDAFSMADITLFVTVDVAGWVDVDARAGRHALDRWYTRVAARPALAA